MKTLKQTSGTNDISLTSDGDLAMSDSQEAYATILSDAIRTVLGELQLNVTAGIDYFGTVFSRVNAIPRWKHDVSEVLLSYDFVKAIGSIDVSIGSDGRLLSYIVEVETDLGVIAVSR